MILLRLVSLGSRHVIYVFNPLNAELNPIWPLPALFGAHHILHVSRIRVKLYVNFAIYIRFIPSVIEVNIPQYMPVYNVHPLANNWDIAAKTKQRRS
jgi:hypothetical protein